MNSAKESRIGWWIKATGLPVFYGHYMPKDCAAVVEAGFLNADIDAA